MRILDFKDFGVHERSALPATALPQARVEPVLASPLVAVDPPRLERLIAPPGDGARPGVSTATAPSAAIAPAGDVAPPQFGWVQLTATALAAAFGGILLGNTATRRPSRLLRRTVRIDPPGEVPALPVPAPASPGSQGTAPTRDEWTARRLRDLAASIADGHRIVVLSNREPVIHRRTRAGGLNATRPVSGVVTALEPLVAACGGSWVAHGSGSADRDVVDDADRVEIETESGAYRLRRVWLHEDEERGYYDGFANEGLWPLCHVAHVRPVFRADDFHTYWQVNARFADAVAAEAQGPTPVLMVQDYHFALAPRLIRERMPDATIVTFWHIPWPNAERFSICPWRRELLEGLLGSSIVGFQTRGHCTNFLDTVQSCLEAHVDRDRQTITIGGRKVLVRAYPISVEWPSRHAAEAQSVEACRNEVLERYSLPADVRLAVGVDRLDYTKGLEEKFEAVERLLECRPELRGRFALVQLAAPTRSRVTAYREYRARVRQAVERVNARFGSTACMPIVLVEDNWQPPDVYRLLRAADVCTVTSLHDGMNLVAKEFVTARDDERGALVLSTFAGAGCELTDALLVNPYDTEETARALGCALDMSEAEQRDRMRRMRARVERSNSFRWAGRMLTDAGRVRDDQRRRSSFVRDYDRGELAV